MLHDSKAFSGFSVNDLAAAKQFYSQVLGLDCTEGGPGMMLSVAGSSDILVYVKPDHQPARFTILNFPVGNIDTAVAELKAKGVRFEHYEGMNDGEDVMRGKAASMGPDIAWFKDPAGNILSILQD